MRCGKAREHISLDLDGHLPADRAVGLTRHLDECADCREYREDLLLGHRLLAATEPRLSENFEWCLQLKLNQTLAQAAAESLHPWQDRGADRAAWFRNFGAAAAVGMAAVLAVAMVTLPTRGPDGGADLPATGPVAANQPAAAGDRLEILRPTAGLQWDLGRSAGGRQVSGGRSPLLGAQRPWFSQAPAFRVSDDPRSIERLQAENLQLRLRVFDYERQLHGMQSQLDSTATTPLELGGERETPQATR